LRQTLEVRRKLLPPGQLEFRNTLANLGDVFATEGKLPEAEAVFRECLELSRAHMPADEPARTELLVKLHTTLIRQGKHAQAEPLARECVALREKHFPEDWRTFNAHAMLGNNLRGQKKFDEAERWLLSGYDGMKRHESAMLNDGVERERFKQVAQYLVNIYEEMSQFDKAAEWQAKVAELEGKNAAASPSTKKP